MAELDFSEVIDFDEVESFESNYITLPAGVYEFNVGKIDKSYFNGSQKIPKCRKLTIEMTVDSDDGQARIFDDFFCCQENLWKIKQFAQSIGLTGKFSIDDILDKCEVGHAHGKAEVYVDTFTGRDGNEHQSNKVKRYIKAEEKKEMKPW